MARRFVGLHLQEPIEISAVPRALGVSEAYLDISVGILLKPQSQALNTLNLHPGLDPGVAAAEILNQRPCSCVSKAASTVRPGPKPKARHGPWQSLVRSLSRMNRIVADDMLPNSRNTEVDRSI